MADTTNSQQTSEPRSVTGQQSRRPKSQNGDAEGQIHEPFEKHLPEKVASTKK